MKKKSIADRTPNWYSAWLKRLLIMKMIVILLLVVGLTASYAESGAQTTKLNLKFSGSTVKDVIEEIERQTDLSFMYDNNEFKVDRQISIDVKNETLKSVVESLLSGMDLKYEIVNRYIVIKSNNANVGSQQQKSISGNVVDNTNSPLPGVSVVVKGTTTGTITDMDGKYTLGNVPANATLLFSFVGMKSQEVTVGAKTVINVILEEESIGIEEVVAVGYGTVKKSVITGAISSIKAEDMENSSVTRAEQAMQGKTAGVQVIAGSGSPGSSMKVRVRGYSTNGNSEPLYIIDGVRSSDMANIDPSNISNIEVLKDAASAAIYGAEGGNGVVLVTTKSGKSGKSEISYDFQYGMQSLASAPKVMSSTQYATYMDEANLIKNASTEFNTNWIDQSFEQSPMQKHNLSFSGGNEKSTFLLSLSYLDQEGIVKGNQDNFKRYNGMFNTDYKVTKWLKVGSNLSLSHSERNSITEDSEYRGVIANALMLDPLTPVEYTGALPASVQSLVNAGQKLVKAPDGNYYGISQYVNGECINPFVSIARTTPKVNSDAFSGSVFLNLTPFKDFTFTSRVGVNAALNNSHTYNREYFYNVDSYNNLAQVSDYDYYSTYLQVENFANYVKKINEHNFNFMLGMSASSQKFKALGAIASPLIKDQESYADLNYVSSQTNDKVVGYKTLDKKVSYFGRLSYDYKGTYLLQGSIRRDGAGLSILPANTRWGIFPSLSAGWVISNEKFFPQSIINHMKLRGSWGQNGSLSNLGGYLYDATITSVSSTASLLYPMADGTFHIASKPSQLSNPDLKWETSEQTDLGVDIHLFKSSLTLTVDYFYKKTKDLITTNTPPLEAGNTASPINAGDVLNKGFEFDLAYKGKVGDLKYSVRSNIATLKNEVTYLNPTITRLNGASINYWNATAFEKGFPVWYFRGYKTNGIDPATGDPNFVDTNKDGVINADDQVSIGSGIPKLNYGLNLTLEYKGFDFSAFGQGQAGNDVLLGLVRTDRPTGNKLDLFYSERWTATNTNATRPRSGVDAKYWNSDGMIFNGNYFRIKQLQLGYTLPKSLLSKALLNHARVYVSLEDFFTFTKYPGTDPEASSTTNNSLGVDRGYFPTAKKMMFGLSVTF